MYFATDLWGISFIFHATRKQIYTVLQEINLF